MRINKIGTAVSVGFIWLLLVATQSVFAADAEKPKGKPSLLINRIVFLFM